MMKANRIPLLFIFVPLIASAQTRSAPDFQITKISKNLISAPQFTYAGAGQYQTNQRERWLEVEVEFTATPEFTDELVVKYYILFNGKVLTGEVTHSNILSGRQKRSVMYIPPNALAHLADNQPITANTCQNATAQIVQQGALKDEATLVRAQPQWYANLPQISGFLLNKDQTPFAPLYWDRYEQIKTSH
jgi:hypothetical protein